MSQWNLLNQELAKYSRLAVDLSFPLDMQPKERDAQGQTKPRTRNYEKTVAKLAREDDCEQAQGRLFMQVLYLATKPTGDISNCLKSLEDGLNKIAYYDDSKIDATLALRLCSPQFRQPQTLVRIFERDS